MRVLLGLCLVLLLGGCNRVHSDHPLFFASDAAGAPKLNPPIDGAGAAAVAEGVAAKKPNPVAFGASPVVGAAAAAGAAGAATPPPPKSNPTLGGSLPVEKENPPPPVGAGAMAGGAPKLKAIVVTMMWMGGGWYGPYTKWYIEHGLLYY